MFEWLRFFKNDYDNTTRRAFESVFLGVSPIKNIMHPFADAHKLRS